MDYGLAQLTLPSEQTQSSLSAARGTAMRIASAGAARAQPAAASNGLASRD